MQDQKRKKRSFHRISKWLFSLAGLTIALLLGMIIYRTPIIQKHLSWRVDAAATLLRTLIFPIGAMPTPVLAEPRVEIITRTALPTQNQSSRQQSTPLPVTPTILFTPTPTPTEAPLPQQVSLPAPAYERQDWNSCGPAALAMILHFYGWEGSQEDINTLIKPLRADRNVNIDELTSYVNQQTSGLRAEYRVGGDTTLLRKLLASGFPIMVEETFYLPEGFWFNDDRWSGHYQVLTGYDDGSSTFITQDSFVGPNRIMSYAELDKNWQAFNRAYVVVYPLEKEEEVKAILKDNWDVNINRQHALETAHAETKTTPNNPFAWFNLGSNLVFFERYPEAANAYDTARKLELPQRMMRYQFGPFLAYFHSGRTEDLLAITDYALKVTPNSEEALLWKGWAMYRLGQTSEAGALFQKALEARPGYTDGLYALNYLQSGN